MGGVLKFLCKLALKGSNIIKQDNYSIVRYVQNNINSKVNHSKQNCSKIIV